MADEQQDERHVFDQTNGQLGEVDEAERPAQLSERDRRRQESMAQGFGYISTGHN